MRTLRFHAPFSGVYLLKKRKKIIYVGQSKNMLFRCLAHSGKPFDEIEMRFMGKTKRMAEECKLLQKYKPPYNKIGIPRIIDPATKDLSKRITMRLTYDQEIRLKKLNRKVRRQLVPNLRPFIDSILSELENETT